MKIAWRVLTLPVALTGALVHGLWLTWGLNRALRNPDPLVFRDWLVGLNAHDYAAVSQQLDRLFADAPAVRFALADVAVRRALREAKP